MSIEQQDEQHEIDINTAVKGYVVADNRLAELGKQLRKDKKEFGQQISTYMQSNDIDSIRISDGALRLKEQTKTQPFNKAFVAASLPMACEQCGMPSITDAQSQQVVDWLVENREKENVRVLKRVKMKD